MTATDVYWDPFSHEIWENPYPIYQRMRAEAPCYYNDKHDFYAFARWQDCDRSLPDAEHFSNARGNIYEFIKSGLEMPPGTVIFEDPPTHDINRGLVVRMFTPRRVAVLEPQIRQYIAKQLDPVADADEFDIIDVLSDKVPMRVIGMLVGIPEDEQQVIRDRTLAHLRTEDGGQIDPEKSMVNGDIFSDYVDWRMQNPSNDIMTDLLNVEFEDAHGVTRRLTKDEILTYCAVIAGAGNETTGQLIGWIGKLLGEHPEVYQEIVHDPSLVPGAVEEILRLEPVGQAVARYVKKDVEFHGQTVPEGSTALFILGSAGRDESIFQNGDEFDIRRDVTQQRSFGVGLHYCLGASLARLEGRLVLDELIKRFPNGWDVDWDRAKLASTSTVRGWETLPLVLRK